MKTKAEIIQEVIKGEGLETMEIMIEKTLSIQEKEFLEMIERMDFKEIFESINDDDITIEDRLNLLDITIKTRIKSAVEGRK